MKFSMSVTTYYNGKLLHLWKCEFACICTTIILFWHIKLWRWWKQQVSSGTKWWLYIVRLVQCIKVWLKLLWMLQQYEQLDWQKNVITEFITSLYSNHDISLLTINYVCLFVEVYSIQHYVIKFCQYIM
jgi:hypothetical protein